MQLTLLLQDYFKPDSSILVSCDDFFECDLEIEVETVNEEGKNV